LSSACPDINNILSLKGDPIFYQSLPVLSNEEIAPNNFILEVESLKMSKNSKAGQFAMIKPQSGSTLLARPFSYFKREGSTLYFLYKIYGKGSRELSELKKGEVLDIWGPLGNGFRETKASEWVFVAGGIGIAPFIFLAQQAPRNIKMTVLFGIRTKDQAILEKDFRELGCDVIFVSEDGSIGKKGLVTSQLENLLKEKMSSKVGCEVFTCGPRPMEAAVARIAIENKIPCQIAYEEYMGCGLGTCMGCVVKCRMNDDWVFMRVCREGPVFMADQIIWEKD